MVGVDASISVTVSPRISTTAVHTRSPDAPPQPAFAVSANTTWPSTVDW